MNREWARSLALPQRICKVNRIEPDPQYRPFEHPGTLIQSEDRRYVVTASGAWRVYDGLGKRVQALLDMKPVIEEAPKETDDRNQAV